MEYLGIVAEHGLDGALHEKRAQMIPMVRVVAQRQDAAALLDATVHARSARRRPEVHPAGPPRLVTQLLEQVHVVVVGVPRHLRARQLPKKLPLPKGRIHEFLLGRPSCCSIARCSIGGVVLVRILWCRLPVGMALLGLHLGDARANHGLQALLPNLFGHQGVVLLVEDRHILHHFAPDVGACVDVLPDLGKVLRDLPLIAEQQHLVATRIREASLPREMPVHIHLLRAVAEVELLVVVKVLVKEPLHLREV